MCLRFDRLRYVMLRLCAATFSSTTEFEKQHRSSSKSSDRNSSVAHWMKIISYYCLKYLKLGDGFSSQKRNLVHATAQKALLCILNLPPFPTLPHPKCWKYIEIRSFDGGSETYTAKNLENVAAYGICKFYLASGGQMCWNFARFYASQRRWN